MFIIDDKQRNKIFLITIYKSNYGTTSTRYLSKEFEHEL